MQATQASASASVEVSWSPPSGGAAAITGYRIFYDGRGIAFLPPTVLNDFVTSINLNLGQETNGGQALSIRAESSMLQLPSEMITVTISSELCLVHKNSHCIGFLLFTALETVLNPSGGGCSSGTAIALGGVVLLVLITTVIIIILVYLLIR